MTTGLLSTSTLETLAADLKEASPIHLLRLRLRFGSPRVVEDGDEVGLTVELVDEMAQPPNLKGDVDAKWWQSLRLSVDVVSPSSYAVEMVVCEPRVTRKSTLDRRISIQWRLRVVVRGCIGSCADALRLMVRLVVDNTVKPVFSPSHKALQAFCAYSQWLSRSILVLPVVTDAIQVTSGALSTATLQSSLCQRVFCVDPNLPPVHIQENYGHAMGTHIWDASIWLSLSLLQSTNENSFTYSSVLELGSGCGLVAIVLAHLQQSARAKPDADEPQEATSRLYFTEKLDALHELQGNLTRNGVHSDRLDVSSLLWGQDACQWRKTHLDIPLDVVLAADVLYHWASHEALLETLEKLLPSSSSAASTVYITHKHRGKATSSRLEEVLVSGVDSTCTKNTNQPYCRWQHWHVRRLARWGTLDVLQLTRRCAVSYDGR